MDKYNHSHLYPDKNTKKISKINSSITAKEKRFQNFNKTYENFPVTAKNKTLTEL